MNRFHFIPLALLALNLGACATVQQREMAQRNCPLGNMTEINVSAAEEPREFALETAARAALRDGYEKFWVVKDHPEPDHSYTMLIRMIPNDGQPPLPDMMVARDVLLTATHTPLPTL